MDLGDKGLGSGLAPLPPLARSPYQNMTFLGLKVLPVSLLLEMPT